MIEIAECCYKNNIESVSFFAFSISNFERSKEEVDNIMNLIKSNRNNFTKRSKNKNHVNDSYINDKIYYNKKNDNETNFDDRNCYKSNINHNENETNHNKRNYNDNDTDFKPKINFYGRKDMLTNEICDIFEDITKETCQNSDIDLNIFFAYSSKDEMMQEKMYYNDKIDLLVRTGNVKRLSDFMLKQVSHGANITFCSDFWPDFSVLRLYMILHKVNFENMYFSSKEDLGKFTATNKNK